MATKEKELKATRGPIPVDITKASGNNPRSGKIDEAAVQELAASIKEKGLLNPIVVRKDGKDFEVVAGHRRLAAVKLLGLPTIEALVYQDLTDDEAREIALIENIQREDLPPWDEAVALKEMRNELKLTVEEIAERTGKTASYVYGRLALGNLAAPVLKALKDGKINLVGATMIGRLQTKEDRDTAQDQLLSELRGEDFVSDAWIRGMLEEEVLRDLKGVPWKLDDNNLVGAAGACSTCPKNSGNQDQLFPGMDAKAPKCLDGRCFASKIKAYSKVIMEKAKASKMEVLTGEKAEQALTRYTSSKLDDTEYVDGGEVSVRKLIANAEEKGMKVERRIAIEPSTGRPFEIVPRAAVKEAERVWGNKVKPGEKAPHISAARKAELAKQRLEKEAANQGLDMIYKKVSAMAKSEDGIKKLCLMLAKNRIKRASYLDENTLFKRRGMEKGNLDRLFDQLPFEEKIALGFESECASGVYVSFASHSAVFRPFPDLGLKWADAMAAAGKKIAEKKAAKPMTKKELAVKVKEAKEDAKARKAAAK